MYREMAGMTAADAARLSGCLTGPQITRIEQGRYKITPAHIATLMKVYGVNDHAAYAELERAALESPTAGWWTAHKKYLAPAYADFIALEDKAQRIRVQHPVLIPGILQCASYARAILSDPPAPPSAERIDTLLSVRMTRQQILNRTANPVVLHAIVPEAAFHAETGSAAIVREQARHLLAVEKLENVTIQVLPLRVPIGSAPAQAATFLGYTHPWPEVVNFDTRGGGLNVDDPEEVGYMEARFERLAKIALPAEATREFLEERTKEKATP